MTVYFVSRHPGARAWAQEQGLRATWLDHLDATRIQPGDVVMGTLPVHLAAEVHLRKAHYWHLEMDLPRELRGCELGAEQMRGLSVQLVRYRVVREEAG